MATGISGEKTYFHDQYWIEGDPDMSSIDTTKPRYRVPTMDEVKALPWNGFTAASTFSGCGGSSLGYKMAGFRVGWASEFIPAAQRVYRINHPGTHLDPRDIREVSPGDVLKAAGLKPGELDLLDGSPPCASFSTAGKREAGWGKVRDYSDTRQRTDDLFHEFIRLVAGVRPKTFVAENVSGLVKGTAKGYFLEILAAMKSIGYVVESRVLDAKWLGVPQSRNRLIFVGVRQDLFDAGFSPAFPKPFPYQYSVRDAMVGIWSDAGRIEVGTFQGDFGKPGQNEPRWHDAGERSASTIKATSSNKDGLLRVVHDTSGTHSQGDITDRPCPAITVGVGGLNSMHFQVHGDGPSFEGHAIEKEWDKLGPGESSEKYMNLVRPDENEPCPTICASHGAAGIAGVTHPTAKRKFTIAELKRVCAFPDDFVLVGTYQEQWERLGRAVPPRMMREIAIAVRDAILVPARAMGLA